MSNTYYTSLSGMMAASYGLQNTSNNVANMQSPGFKRNDVFYSSLGNSSPHDGLGSGVTVGGRSTNFHPGTYLETGNPSDLAIVGDGFFIVRMKNGELLYTRDGEFNFNQDGFLEDKHSGGLVQGYNEHGSLVAIKGKGPEVCLGKATHSIDLHGQFVGIEKKREPNDPTPIPMESDYETVSIDLDTIYDAQGKKHRLHLEFESPKEPGPQGNKSDIKNWSLLKASCDGHELSFTPQNIVFDSDSNGAAIRGNSQISLSIMNDQALVLKFGEYLDSADGKVKLVKKDYDNPQTKVGIYKQDGYGEGRQTSFSFDDNGQISYLYSNGQSIKGIHLALADFDDLQHSLIQAHDNLFRAKSDKGRRIGRANKDGLGTIQPQKLESSNVDSTAEFANIVVLQRMFQACSQIMEIDKQLLEELYKK